MLRAFEQHKIRKCTDLCGIWRLDPISENGVSTGGKEVFVPGCWESVRGFENYRGKCKYTKTVTAESENVRLVFYGVGHTADVFVDGAHIAHHYNAYTPFDAVVTGLTAGEHLIEVIADNTFSENSALHIPNDYRSYGGITRPVALEELKNAYVHHLHITPIFEDGAWKAELAAEIDLLSDECEFYVDFLLGNRSVFSGKVINDGGKCSITHTVSFENACEWSPENPHLYYATAVLKNSDGEIIDDLTERFGLRRVETRGRKIFLNGKELYIKGFNRHEDYGTLGSAVPPEIMNTDIDMIKSAGANTVRCSHYPNDQRFLDFCDERGVLVWDEIHARGLGLQRMQNPNFKKQSADCISEAVLNHYNHPSVIIWGILNECSSDTEYGAECYRLQYEQLRSLDKSRLLTAASNKFYKDLTFKYADIVSLNIYPRWFLKDDPLDLITKLNEWVISSGGEDKPLLVSECGASAVYGYRGFCGDKYSEERQSDIIRELLEKLGSFEALSGIIIWQFADCRVDEDFADWVARPKTENNKGLLDIYRRPKLAYYTACDGFKKIGGR